MNVFQIHPHDNVAVAVDAVAKGSVVTAGGKTFTVCQDIPAGHKVALQPIAKGEDVIKYGFPIGTAKTDIPVGAWVHTQNVQSKLGDLLHYTYEPEKADRSPWKSEKKYEFQGYKRSDGSAGIRNEVWIIPTVGCVNNIARAIETASQAYKTENIDGIYAYSHPHGCSQLGDDQVHTQKILSGLIHNPNAGAVLVLSLGCENNQVSLMKEVIGDYDPDRVKFLVCQDVEDEIEAGTAIVKDLCHYAAQFHRQPCDASLLTIGLKCGGSDGFSGITANPLVGEISNRLIAAGGTSILTEVPEMFGAERILMSHCRDEETFEKTVTMVNDFKQYFIAHNQPIYENPSPGNKAGGITTLEEKSLGCTQKAGASQVVDVLRYGERLKVHGLNLLSAPGNDAVATSALAGAGCHMVLFSTGRGTPYGGFVPTVKIATNSELAAKKPHWIDFDAGGLVHGVAMETLLSRFIDLIVEIASGRPARNETNDFRELAIFKSGVTL